MLRNLLLALILSLPGQVVSQQPTNQTGTHPRIPQTEAIGRRVDLKSLKGARLFIGPGVNPNKPVPLVVHFHGLPWLVEAHIARYLPKAALITVQLGAGSNAYRRPFEQADLFQNLLSEAGESLGTKRDWASITLTGFSAGYGGVREILRRPEYFALVNNVLLLDGMHTSYVPEGKVLADGGALDASGVDVLVKFAREAVAGRKTFVFTHSEIFPAAYASTTECANYLLSQLNLKRKSKLAQGPMGMQQLSAVDVKGFHVRGYAGNTAPDHVD
ncbi:MAG: hypothetical protein M3R52_09795, partial [Acidobacteriota bacterium]|nr:hypothetical protein [Acidobacteriota bacterium]